MRLSSLIRLPTKLKRRARRHRAATLLILALLLLLLLAPFYIIYRPPRLLIRAFQHRWPDVLWEVSLPPSTQKLIALTIDDAPSEHTRALLALLRAHDAHATLFVIGGQVDGREEVLREAVAAGNELGNHAMHDEAAAGLPLDELEAQIERVQALIRRAYRDAAEEKEGVGEGEDAGPKEQYFRPGSGLFNTRMRAMVARLGYRLVLGSVYPHDPQIPYWWLNAWHVLSMARNGAIVVCHDRRSWTIPMLAKVLPELKRRGYRVVTVTELLEAAAGS